MQPNVYFLINHNQAGGTYPVYTKRLFYFNNIGNLESPVDAEQEPTLNNINPFSAAYVFVLIILLSQYGRVFVFVQTPS